MGPLCPLDRRGVAAVVAGTGLEDPMGWSKASAVRTLAGWCQPHGVRHRDKNLLSWCLATCVPSREQIRRVGQQRSEAK